VGDKSRVANPDNYDAAEFPDFAKATPFTGDLLPGDVLYIPAMWFHSVLNVTYTLSVNVFWKTLRDELYDLKDAYGNKEPVPIARLMQSLQSGLKTVTASGLRLSTVTCTECSLPTSSGSGSAMAVPALARIRNQKLITYLAQDSILDQLVDAIVTEPSAELPPSPALSSGQRLLRAAGLRCRRPDDRPGHATASRKQSDRLLAYLSSKGEEFIDLLIRHMGTSAVMDFLVSVVTMRSVDEYGLQYQQLQQQQSTQVAAWLAQTGLVDKLLATLASDRSPEEQYNGAQCLINIIAYCRDLAAAAQDSSEAVNSSSAASSTPSATLLDQLESGDTAGKLLAKMLDGAGAAQRVRCGGRRSGAAGAAGRPRGANGAGDLGDFSSIASMALAQQQQQPAASETERLAAAALNVIEAVSPRLPKLAALLSAPPPHRLARMPTTAGRQLEPPLGQCRLHVARLVRSLLSTNSALAGRAVAECGALPQLLSLMLAYPWNTFLHQAVEQSCTSVLTAQPANQDQTEAQRQRRARIDKSLVLRRRFLAFVLAIQFVAIDVLLCLILLEIDLRSFRLCIVTASASPTARPDQPPAPRLGQRPSQAEKLRTLRQRIGEALQRQAAHGRLAVGPAAVQAALLQGDAAPVGFERRGVRHGQQMEVLAADQVLRQVACDWTDGMVAMGAKRRAWSTQEMRPSRVSRAWNCLAAASGLVLAGTAAAAASAETAGRHSSTSWPTGFGSGFAAAAAVPPFSLSSPPALDEAEAEAEVEVEASVVGQRPGNNRVNRERILQRVRLHQLLLDKVHIFRMNDVEQIMANQIALKSASANCIPVPLPPRPPLPPFPRRLSRRVLRIVTGSCPSTSMLLLSAVESPNSKSTLLAECQRCVGYRPAQLIGPPLFELKLFKLLMLLQRRRRKRLRMSRNRRRHAVRLPETVGVAPAGILQLDDAIGRRRDGVAGIAEALLLLPDH
uniref:JmjC domain-containing protein n=1 Tax=Macrostomum lignano TaxID=282301 RepID=A0A1I8IL15_9PLAT